MHSPFLLPNPADDTRVELESVSGVPGSDYVNANHVLVRNSAFSSVRDALSRRNLRC